MLITELGLSNRVCNILKRNDIYTSEELEKKASMCRLKKMHGLGPKGIKEILGACKKYGIEMRWINI